LTAERHRAGSRIVCRVDGAATDLCKRDAASCGISATLDENEHQFVDALLSGESLSLEATDSAGAWMLHRGETAIPFTVPSEGPRFDGIDPEFGGIVGLRLGDVVEVDSVRASLEQRFGAVTLDTGWYEGGGQRNTGRTYCLAHEPIRMLFFDNLRLLFVSRDGADSLVAWSLSDHWLVMGWAFQGEDPSPSEPVEQLDLTTETGLGIGTPNNMTSSGSNGPDGWHEEYSFAGDGYGYFTDYSHPLAQYERLVYLAHRNRSLLVSVKDGAIAGLGNTITC
jgi:hypothetical protein